ncbi:hypothetical protein Barb6_00997 [Bacteroidales bacterium Barb6]|nr:hypothetical protein Barb6_00997 [Bacteroidales bacterium Barb6]
MKRETKITCGIRFDRYRFTLLPAVEFWRLWNKNDGFVQGLITLRFAFWTAYMDFFRGYGERSKARDVEPIEK